MLPSAVRLGVLSPRQSTPDQLLITHPPLIEMPQLLPPFAMQVETETLLVPGVGVVRQRRQVVVVALRVQVAVDDPVTGEGESETRRGGRREKRRRKRYCG